MQAGAAVNQLVRAGYLDGTGRIYWRTAGAVDAEWLLASFVRSGQLERGRGVAPKPDHRGAAWPLQALVVPHRVCLLARHLAAILLTSQLPNFVLCR